MEPLGDPRTSARPIRGRDDEEGHEQNHGQLAGRKSNQMQDQNVLLYHGGPMGAQVAGSEVSSSLPLVGTEFDCAIGLGANLGLRILTLTRAVSRLQNLGVVAGLSGLYETVPVGGPPQPDFLNAAVRLKTSLAPQQLLEALKAIERSLGRQPGVHWGPRRIDLDLLWIRDLHVLDPMLQVPHPRLAERAFALRPMLDVAPAALHPATGEAYAMIARQLSQHGVRCVAPSRSDPPWRWHRPRETVRDSGGSRDRPTPSSNSPQDVEQLIGGHEIVDAMPFVTSGVEYDHGR